MAVVTPQIQWEGRDTALLGNASLFDTTLSRPKPA
jgi:hypothetical protein